MSAEGDRIDAGLSGDWFPIEPEQHAAQVVGLRRMLAETEPGPLLDLGAGDGRVAREVASSRHPVIAIDRDRSACERCAGAHVRAVVDDFLSASCWDSIGVTDAVGACCLGNTFALISDVDEALGLLRHLGRCVRRGGFLAIDNMCPEVWADVAEGNWQSGVSEDEGLQLVWGRDDSVIALRGAGRIDEGSWDVTETDVPLRLWGMGHLRLLVLAAGWEGPIVLGADHLIVVRAPGDSSP